MYSARVRFDVAIVGGAMVGGSLAAALADSGLEVALIDPRSAPPGSSRDLDLRVYALRPASRAFLERCGIWRHIDTARIAPVYEIAVFGDDGVSRLTFDAYRAGIRELAVIAEDSQLQSATHAALNEKTLVTRLPGRTCANARWDDEGVTIELDDGQQVNARLAVAADGSESRLRELGGIGTEIWPYHEHGVVANFQVEQSHHGVAYQWFRDDGILALLPLPGDQVSMVWSTADAHADELLNLDPDKLAARVMLAAGKALGELKATGAAAGFALRRMRAKSIVGHCLALVGDAAHNVHPLAGQGLNLGLADAEVLAGVISSRAPGEQAGSRALLARYRRARAEEIAAMAYTTDGLHRLFASQLPGIAWLRNTGLRLTDNLPTLKRLLVKHAAG
ncbi:MAG: UbiH/UbiF family hydroxylase [Burkholderiales bacterium]